MEIRLSQPFSFQQLGLRCNQEDSRFPDCDEPKASQSYFLVCDGVGGSEKGEVASRTVCDAFGEALSSFSASYEFSLSNFETALGHAFAMLEAKTDDSNRGMATTLSFAAFHRNGCFIAHIGDSRVYYIRPGSGIIYRTEDHSLVQALVRAGAITEEQAKTHPRRNVITRAIGVTGANGERPTATTINITDIQPGDYVFLCSDGVLSEISDETLVKILSSNISDREKRDQIASICQNSGDNNTAWIIRVDNVAGEMPAIPSETRPQETVCIKAPYNGKAKRPARWLVALLIGLAAVLLAFAILQAFTNNGTEQQPFPEIKTEELSDTTAFAKISDVFPGGDNGFRNFINKNKRYPEKTGDGPKDGIVSVSFRLTETQGIEDIRIKRSLSPAFDGEALRLVGMMPKLKPLLDKNGKPIATEVTMAIGFLPPKEKIAPKEKPHRTPSANTDEGKQGKKEESNPSGNKPEPAKSEAETESVGTIIVF